MLELSNKQDRLSVKIGRCQMCIVQNVPIRLSLRIENHVVCFEISNVTCHKSKKEDFTFVHVKRSIVARDDLYIKTNLTQIT